MRSLIDIIDFSVEELDELLRSALDIIEKPEKYAHACAGKKLATLFYEPSTRTRCSFEAAMMELGGYVLSTADAGKSSAAKGESMADTAKIMSCYADIMAIRHPMAGAALVAARAGSIPVINAGDGAHCHPTQTLADLLTIYREKGGFEGLKIGLCGDLKYGRTVHSLVSAMTRYEGVSYVLVSPKELAMPDYVKKTIEDAGQSYTESADLEAALPEMDVLYMTRIQKERFDEPAQYEQLKDSYILTPELMKLAKADCIVLHPLPRVNEISVAVDDDPRAAYFRQALNGKYMREALILKLLKEAGKLPSENISEPLKEKLLAANSAAKAHAGHTGTKLPAGDPRRCTNPKCITKIEQELPEETNAAGQCIYCEWAME